ncbi:TetR/AcrR family transcriptional regulator [Novosphingobium cyanobacteriorum]|uniref:Helix-turn-helix domain containing protein n=1 Tax=Novosphingobium cyanobacteriorum TaxID=3024215 RepID=A0ABT6CRS3_9SPHN|nr:TetR/AcrR family transcriptional regulator [Novosphingobium cyanobacteriorum]MDF8335312.1 helix-turn-helix domain containing protein [Novosphingobium cyanobacteriorum]
MKVEFKELFTPPMSRRKWEITCSIAKAFAARGYHAVGMRELAGMLKLNQGTLYHHFSSKQDALLAICMIGQSEVTSNLSSSLNRYRDFDGRISAMFDAHQLSLNKFGDFLDVYSSLWFDLPEELVAALRPGWVTQRALFEQLHLDALRNREISPDLTVKDGMRLLFGLFRTINLLHRTGRSEEIALFVKRAVPVIQRGMKV